MSRLDVQLRNEKKVAELTGQIQKTAKELQNVIESRDLALQDVKTLGERKATLSWILNNLEIQIKEKKQALSELFDKENHFNDSIKQEQAREKLSLKDTQNVLEKTKDRLNEASVVKNELENFLKKESNAREKYLLVSDQLSESERKYLEFEKKYQGGNESLIKANEGLDAYKKYLSDLYGKLATYVSMAKSTLDHINEELSTKKVPFFFKLPPDEIIEINFDNFNIKKTDT